jgi:hypothetical protein
VFQFARNPGSTAPDVGWLTYSGTIVRGAVLIWSSNTVFTAGADPTAIVGVAMQASDSGPGWNQANSPTVVTGRQSKMSVSRANRNMVFRGKLTSGSSTRVAPAATDIDVSYGITAYSGVWTVDRAKTSSGVYRVQVIGYDDLGIGDVFFKFLESAITPNP